MLLEFIVCVIQRRDAADGQFADGSRQGGLRADGFQKGIPAVSDGWGVEEGFVQGDEFSSPSFFDPFDDCLVFGVGHLGVVGDVGETHGGGFWGVVGGKDGNWNGDG
jgi:hypothetical protein